MAKGKKSPMNQISMFAIPHDNFKELVEEKLSDNVGSVDIVDNEVVLALDNSFLENSFSEEYDRDINSVMVKDEEAEVSHSVSSDALISVMEENLPNINGSVDVVDSEIVVTLHKSFLEDSFSKEYGRDINYVLVKDEGAELVYSIFDDKLTKMVKEKLPNIETSSETFLEISNSVDFRDGEVVVALDNSFLEKTVYEKLERDVDSVEVKEEGVEVRHSISSSELIDVMEKNIPDIDGSVKVMGGEVVVTLDDFFLEETVSQEFEWVVDSVEVGDETSKINHSVSDDELSSVMDKNLPNIEGSVKIIDDSIGLVLEKSHLKEIVAREYGRKVDTIEIEAEEVEVNLSDEPLEVEEEVGVKVEEEESPSEEVGKEVSSEEVEEESPSEEGEEEVEEKVEEGESLSEEVEKGEVSSEVGEKEEEFKCKHCGSKFGTEEGLNIHKSRLHEEEEEEEETGSDVSETHQKERLKYIEDQLGKN